LKDGPESFVVVTGLSGSGKSYVERCFEDLGYFCVDNLPLALMDPLLDEVLSDRAPRERVCVVLDVRNPDFAGKFPETYRRMKSRVPAARLIFLDASEEALLRRFSETRRPHPLSEGQPLLDSLRNEREILAEVRAMADLVVDTSGLTVHELRGFIARTFRTGEEEIGLVVSLTSFGYKFGAPYDVDLLFDVRFLANPHFIADLRPKTGEEAAVAAFIEKDPETGPFLDRLADFVGYLLPRYRQENKSYLSIGIGCTGGRHRSVYIAERLADNLRKVGYPVRLRHRDVARD
jgi:UPF0042 nucleotide-binding protein